MNDKERSNQKVSRRVKFLEDKCSSTEDAQKPVLRACGCAHRFQTNGNRNKSLSGYRRRSKSCAPSNDAPTIKKEDQNNLTRHCSESDLKLTDEPIKYQREIEITLGGNENYKFQSRYSWRPPTTQTYTTTVYIDLQSTEKRYVEQISMEMKLTRGANTEASETQKLFSNVLETTITAHSDEEEKKLD